MALDCKLWAITTPYGDALRGESEATETEDGWLSITGVRPRGGIIPSLVAPAGFKVHMFMCKDMPNLAGRTEIRNVCGFVAGYSVMSDHPAWRQKRSTLGQFREAYTLRGGNCIFLRGKAIFKGGRDPNGVRATMDRLVRRTADGPLVLRAYLIVVTTHLHRNLCVSRGCLMEQMLDQQTACTVMPRHDELSNAVIFYIHSWSQFDVPKDSAPDQGTISVSRRGVVNVRYTWHDGVEWTDNSTWERLTESVRAFLLMHC